jgi:predicted nucleic acid-binding protein
LRVVCDASTLIALARIGQLDILPLVGAQVVIPMAVYEEVVVKGAGKPGSDAIRQASWIETREVFARDLVRQFRTFLGIGESEVIALAKESDADLILLDDADARETAFSEGLDVVGLLAFLVLAKENGAIKLVRPLLNALRRQGFFFSDDLYHRILQKADESCV